MYERKLTMYRDMFIVLLTVCYASKGICLHIIVRKILLHDSKQKDANSASTAQHPPLEEREVLMMAWVCMRLSGGQCALPRVEGSVNCREEGGHNFWEKHF